MKNHKIRVLGLFFLAIGTFAPLFAQTPNPNPVDVPADGFHRKVRVTAVGTGNAPNGEFTTGNRQLGGNLTPNGYNEQYIACDLGPFPSGYDLEFIDITKDIVEIRIIVRAANNCGVPLKAGQSFTASESPASPGQPYIQITSNKMKDGCGGSGTGSFTVNKHDVYSSKIKFTPWVVGHLDLDFKMNCASVGEMSGKVEFSEETIPAGYELLNPDDAGGGGGGTTPGTPEPPPPPDAFAGFPQTVLENGVVMTNDSTQTITVSTITQNSFVGDVDIEVISDSTEAEGLITSLSTTHFGSPGTGSSTLTIRAGANTLPRDYSVTIVTSANGKQAFNTVRVTVICDPPMILGIDQPRGATVTGGGSASLETKAVGSGPFAYQWYTGPPGSTNFPVSGATGAKLTTGNDGMYWVRVSNACGSVDSAAALVSRQ